MMSRVWRDQRGEGELLGVAVIFAVIGLAWYGGYQLYNDWGGTHGPQMIDADGQTYLSCKGAVSVSKEGGGLLGGGSDTFYVKFTDVGELAHEIHGVHKVSLTDVPKLVNAPMPFNPSTTDRDGKPLVNGSIYTWPDGSKAKFHDGTFEPVQVPNDVCSSKPTRVP